MVSDKYEIDLSTFDHVANRKIIDLKLSQQLTISNRVSNMLGHALGCAGHRVSGLAEIKELIESGQLTINPKNQVLLFDKIIPKFGLSAWTELCEFFDINQSKHCRWNLLPTETQLCSVILESEPKPQRAFYCNGNWYLEKDKFRERPVNVIKWRAI